MVKVETNLRKNYPETPKQPFRQKRQHYSLPLYFPDAKYWHLMILMYVNSSARTSYSKLENSTTFNP